MCTELERREYSTAAAMPMTIATATTTPATSPAEEVSFVFPEEAEVTTGSLLVVSTEGSAHADRTLAGSEAVCTRDSVRGRRQGRKTSARPVGSVTWLRMAWTRVSGCSFSYTGEGRACVVAPPSGKQARNGAHTPG